MIYEKKKILMVGAKASAFFRFTKHHCDLVDFAVHSVKPCTSLPFHEIQV